MKGIFVKGLVLWTAILLAACEQRKTYSGETIEEEETTEVEDTTENDSTTYFEEEDEGLVLTERTEVFSDFIYAFTHNSRFQAERIRFPLPVVELDGEERTIRSGRQFRSEFGLPGNDYYTLILDGHEQMDILEGDTTKTEVTLQCIHLQEQTMTCYDFSRTGGKWHLDRRRETGLNHRTGDFLHFYAQFMADSLFQQESLAPNLRISMADEEGEDEDIEGTIEPGQWPVFRPDMPEGDFVCIDFGQPYTTPHSILFLQCGLNNGFINIFSFRKEGENWKLTAYEN